MPAVVALLTCIVVGVSDGDTLTARCKTTDPETVETTKIRLSGIDAPEKRQPFGTASRDSLAALTFGKSIEATCHKSDRYARRVCTVAADGEDVGLKQIRVGLAWHYKSYEREQPVPERTAYAQGEMAAHAARRGLWQDPSPVPPWEWRRPTP
jgi:endonuclease YncB( thermonuclease family)